MLTESIFKIIFITSSCLMGQQALKVLPYGRNLNVSGLASRALNDFDSIVGNLLSDIDSKRDTNQVGVLELDSWPFVAVIE